MDEWRRVRLGDLIEVRHGFAFDGRYFVDQPVADILVTPGNFAIGGGFKVDKLKYYLGPVPEEFVLAPGDLVVTMTDLSKEGDTLGYGAIVPKLPRHRLLHNQRIGRVAVKRSELVIRDFLHWLLRTPAYRHEILGSATGSTVKHTAPSRIAAYEFALPPVDQQRAIAHVLGTLDDKIELNRKMSETLEELARTLFKSWFVDFDPVHAKAAGEKPFGMDDATAALFPDSFEDSELGPIPRGWRVGTLGQWADIHSGGTPSKSRPELWNGGVPWISPKVMTAIHADDPDQFVTEGAIGNGTRLAPARSTLVMVRGMALHQGVRVSQTRREVTFNQDVKALVPREIHPDLLLFALLDARTSLLSKVHAAGHGTGVLGTDMLSAVTLCLPQPSEQPPFAEIFATLNDRIALARAESRTLAELRDTLLPRLLSGELRVPLDVVEAADTGRGQLGLFESV